MYRKILYKKAYRLLKDSTPLKFDCGFICGSKCCSGDSDMGMYLYPGEEVMFSGHDEFLCIRQDKLRGTDVLFAVCDGKCDRKYRPLSCRIFPFAPYIDETGRLTVIEDPRAKYVCPLLLESMDLKIDNPSKGMYSMHSGSLSGMMRSAGSYVCFHVPWMIIKPGRNSFLLQ